MDIIFTAGFVVTLMLAIVALLMARDAHDRISAAPKPFWMGQWPMGRGGIYDMQYRYDHLPLSGVPESVITMLQREEPRAPATFRARIRRPIEQNILPFGVLCLAALFSILGGYVGFVLSLPRGLPVPPATTGFGFVVGVLSGACLIRVLDLIEEHTGQHIYKRKSPNNQCDKHERVGLHRVKHANAPEVRAAVDQVPGGAQRKKTAQRKTAKPDRQRHANAAQAPAPSRGTDHHPNDRAHHQPSKHAPQRKHLRNPAHLPAPGEESAEHNGAGA